MNVILREGILQNDMQSMIETLHGVDFSDIDGSTQKIFEEQYDIMVAQGQGKINAELMAAGIQWYLDTMARKALKDEEEYHAEPDDDKDTSDNYPEGWDESDLNY